MPQTFDMSRRSQPAHPRPSEPEQGRPVTVTGSFDEPLRPDRPAADEPSLSPQVQGGEAGDPPTAMTVLRQLLLAMAREETALAHLLCAEAEKVKSLTMAVPATIPFDALLEYQRSVRDMLQLVVRKEEVLLKKLRLVASLTQAALAERN